MNYKKAIAVFGGSIIKKDGRWSTINFDASDDFGIDGGRLRVVAGYHLYNSNPEHLIIALGGKGQLKDIKDAPPVSEVVKQELIELGVLSDKMVKEECSNNSFQQLQELKKIIKSHKLNNIQIISNEYHLPRLEAMIRADKGYERLLDEEIIELVSAEEVLMRREPEVWQGIIENAYNSEAMERRIKMEARGVKDIEEGKYKFK